MDETKNFAAVLMLVIGFVALVVGVVISMSEEATDEIQAPFFSTPTPTAISHGRAEVVVTSPTPIPSFASQQEGIGTSALVNRFVQAAYGEKADEQGDHLIRWGSSVPVILRGRPTFDDEACLRKIRTEVNSFTAASYMQIIEEPRQNSMEVYLLDRDQFPSIQPDARTDLPATSVYWWNNSYTMYKSQSLIDSDQLPADRCYYIRVAVLRSMGARHWVVDNPLPGSYVSVQQPFDNLNYSKWDREIIRTLYSENLVPGLTENEARRRLGVF